MPAYFMPAARGIGIAWISDTTGTSTRRLSRSAFTQATKASLPAVFEAWSQNTIAELKLDGTPLAKPTASRLHAPLEGGASGAERSRPAAMDVAG
jgi:hypothetical protein